jgi:hypothetical protein
VRSCASVGVPVATAREWSLPRHQKKGSRPAGIHRNRLGDGVALPSARSRAPCERPRLVRGRACSGRPAAAPGRGPLATAQSAIASVSVPPATSSRRCEVGNFGGRRLAAVVSSAAASKQVHDPRPDRTCFSPVGGRGVHFPLRLVADCAADPGGANERRSAWQARATDAQPRVTSRSDHLACRMAGASWARRSS